MENQLSEVLDNLLGLLLLEGSYEIEDKDEAFLVSIETKDAGRLIGFRGESLEALQLLVNQIMSRKIEGPVPSEAKGGGVEGPALSESAKGGQVEGFKRVVLDVEGWRKQKEEELSQKAESWGKQVLETGQVMELEPQSAWQRRIVHMVISEMEGVESESVGEGRDRHVVIKLKSKQSLRSKDLEKVKSEEELEKDAEPKED